MFLLRNFCDSKYILIVRSLEDQDVFTVYNVYLIFDDGCLVDLHTWKHRPDVLTRPLSVVCGVRFTSLGEA